MDVAIGDLILNVIEDEVKVGESVYYSEPLIECALGCNACKAYERLAGEVIA